MAGLCEGGNESPGSLKVTEHFRRRFNFDALLISYILKEVLSFQRFNCSKADCEKLIFQKCSWCKVPMYNDFHYCDQQKGVLSTTVPEFPAFRNISAKIHSLRALPRALRYLGRVVGMDPELLCHFGDFECIDYYGIKIEFLDSKKYMNMET
ncbi:hypothetical protein ANN_10468 [Periplaneta americana]|uniref:Uncharacterized protein n=1 Tax=Periplaneta americana TaxID=6978 RepID=A0ABQ8TPD0_PERAM|nr:hypothetical protein ANN_10468 [Periplaneta americana]